MQLKQISDLFHHIHTHTQLSSLVTSGGEDRGRLDDLGSQVAQLRERLAELDRAVTALSNTGTHSSNSLPRYKLL